MTQRCPREGGAMRRCRDGLCQFKGMGLVLSRAVVLRKRGSADEFSAGRKPAGRYIPRWRDI